MATALQPGMASRKKKSTKGESAGGDGSGTVPPLSLFPKIGGCGGGALPSAHAGYHTPHADAATLPKLKPSGGEGSASASQPGTRRSGKPATDAPTTGGALALPSVSPRLPVDSAALTTKILNSISDSSSGIEEMLAAAAVAQTARRASSAKKRDKSTKKKKVKPTADPDFASFSNRTVVAPTASVEADDDDYEYEDEPYLSERSTPSTAANPRTPNPPPAESPLIPTVTVKRKGPSVQPASRLHSDPAPLEISEELDSSFQAPPFSPQALAYARTRTLRVTNTEVEEEASAQLCATLSPQALRQALDLDTSITDDTVAAGGEEEESVLTLLLASPSSSASRHPTSIHPPTLQSPTAGAKATKGGAKAVKKKPTPALTKPPAPKTPTGAAGRKKPHASTPIQKPPKDAPFIAHASPIEEYADDDWRNQTTAFPIGGGKLQNQLDAAAPSSSGFTDCLPSEMIRFTLKADTVESLYAQSSLPPQTLFNTTVEFSRSQRLNALASDSSEDATQWVPVFSTTLNPSRSSSVTSGGVAFATSTDSVFTVDRESLGADPNESLLVRLWNTVYNDPDDTRDSSVDTSLTRTLLAEFHTNVNDFAAQSKAGAGLDRTQPIKQGSPELHEPRLNAVAPRSAMKPSSSDRGSSPPPSKPRVRFFDHVEIFRLSAPLDRTLPVALSLGSTVELEEKQAVTTEDEAHDLASIFVSEQIFNRRGRMSAGTQRTGSATASKKPPLPTKKKEPAPTTTAGAVPPLVVPTFVRLHAQASDLPKMAFHGSANAILEVIIFFNGIWQKPLYRSECQFNTLEPQFKPFVLCAPHSDALLDAPVLLKIVHFDDAKSDEADTIGQCICTLRSLLPTGDAAATPPRSFVLTHPAKQRLSSKRTQCGQLTLRFLPPATPSASSSRRGSSTNSPLQGAPSSAVAAATPATATAAAATRRKSNGPPAHSSRPTSKVG